MVYAGKNIGLKAYGNKKKRNQNPGGKEQLKNR